MSQYPNEKAPHAFDYTPPAGSSTPQEEHLSRFGPKGNPEGWNRLPPPHLPYNAFPPMRLISNGHDLKEGFPEIPPPCALTPHPFATHDVTKADWTRFLADIQNASGRSNMIPLVTGMNFLNGWVNGELADGRIAGFLATKVMERKMMDSDSGDRVDHWNHYFFGPRRMAVVLRRASERLSGGVEGDEDAYRHHGARGRQRGERSGERSGDNRLPYELVVRSI